MMQKGVSKYSLNAVKMYPVCAAIDISSQTGCV